MKVGIHMVCTQQALAGQVAHTQGAGTQAGKMGTRAGTQAGKMGTRAGTQAETAGTRSGTQPG